MSFFVIGFVVVFLLVLLSGFPVGFGLGFLAMGLLACYTDLDMAMTTSVEKAYASIDSSILVTVSLFVLAAQLISESGMGKRLFDAAKVFFGKFHSGLGIATIASSGVFSAMTGSSFVSASTMGLIAIPELRKAGYSDTLISAAITAGGSLGAVIPPSIILIVYGYLTDESIGKLFAAGMIPGILLIILYSIGIHLCSGSIGLNNPENSRDKKNQFSDSKTQTLDSENMDKFTALKEAFWGLMAPVIILGGIYLGIFTASEAAAMVVAYCIFIGFLVYRTLTIKKLWAALIASANVTAMVAMIIIGGAILGHVIVFGRIPQEFLEFVVACDFSPLLLLILINIILFVLGMFLEVLALVYLAIPLIHPVVLHMGWDNIWFAIIFLINVNLALITPPMGGVLFVVSQIGNISIEKVIKGAVLPIGILILLLIFLIAFPPIATWLPNFI